VYVNGLIQSNYLNDRLNPPAKAAANSLNTSFESLSLPEGVGIDAVIFAMGTKDGSWVVTKAKDYSEENPTYVVSGKYKGESYETVVNANDVNPGDASSIEMSALMAHLKEKGVIDSVELHPYFVDQDNNLTERGLFEKFDWIPSFTDMYEKNLKNSNYPVMLNIGKILSALNARR
jgi:hypothetical protein